jgi:hypothetical protein
MTVVLYADNASTTLASGISSGTTTIILETGTGALFPSPTTGQFFALTLNDALTGQVYEVCYCTARTGDSLTVTRGQEGTTAVAWLLGDFAYNAVTKATIPAPIGITEFGTAGTYSYTVPFNVFQLVVQLWGATGGSGGSQSTGAASGAGAGGYTIKTCSVSPGQVFTIVIGEGGAAGGTGTAGGNGTVSTVVCAAASVSMTANPGQVGLGGLAGTGAGAAAGGTASGGDQNLQGGGSQAGGVNGTLYLGGAGGASPFGGGITSVTVGTPQPGNLPGGGPGGGANAQNGVAGNAGWCRITIG